MLKKSLTTFFALGVLLGGLSFIPFGSDDPNPEMEIYLLSNAIHTDIVVPVRNQVFDWESFLDPKDFRDRPSDWLELGWGDRRFYFEMPTWDKFTMELALDALFLPDPAVMHVNYLYAHPEQYSSAKKIKISFATYEKLVKSIRSQFILKEERPMIILGKSYSDSDNFYEAQCSYSLIRTCNVWTAEILKASGLKHPLWSPTKWGLNFIY